MEIVWEIQHEKSEKWYEHALEGVVDNVEVKILWDVMIQRDREVKARKPDIAVVNKYDRSCARIRYCYTWRYKTLQKREGKI